MILYEARPGSSDVGGGTDEEEHNDDHAIKAKESTLCFKESTILKSLRSYQLIIK